MCFFWNYLELPEISGIGHFIPQGHMFGWSSWGGLTEFSVPPLGWITTLSLLDHQIDRKKIKKGEEDLPIQKQKETENAASTSGNQNKVENENSKVDADAVNSDTKLRQRKAKGKALDNTESSVAEKSRNENDDGQDADGEEDIYGLKKFYFKETLFFLVQGFLLWMIHFVTRILSLGFLIILFLHDIFFSPNHNPSKPEEFFHPIGWQSVGSNWVKHFQKWAAIPSFVIVVILSQIWFLKIHQGLMKAIRKTYKGMNEHGNESL